MDRYDELRALATADPKRLGLLPRHQRRVILAIDGLQPDVGHEVLWVLRDCLSGEILLAKSLLSSTAKDLSGLITEVRRALPVPITGAITDGQGSIRKAVAQAVPWRPPSALPFPLSARGGQADLRGGPSCQEGIEGAGPGHPPDRASGREMAGGESDDEEAEIVRCYCAAVRAALTDDGGRRWPLRG